MRRICYSLATSLDGYIAGPNGEVDWIVRDVGSKVFKTTGIVKLEYAVERSAVHDRRK